MLRLRPYKKEDADTIISWSKDEKAFYQWSAGVTGEYPLTPEKFRFVDSLMAFTAFDEPEIDENIKSIILGDGEGIW